jgi:cob(I)alamin adenosyltransferase
VRSFKEKDPLFYKSASIDMLNEAVKKDIQKTEAILRNKKYNFVVLDELLYLLQKNLIKEKDILRLIGLKPYATELVLTGGSASSSIIDCADYISRINDEKHPFRKGTKARRGIEY